MQVPPLPPRIFSAIFLSGMDLPMGGRCKFVTVLGLTLKSSPQRGYGHFWSQETAKYRQRRSYGSLFRSSVFSSLLSTEDSRQNSDPRAGSEERL